MPEWITVKVASGKLNVAERTVRHYIAQGKLSAKKEGNRWLIDEDSIGNVGKPVAEDAASSARPSATDATIAVSLERYEALITRLAQLEAENTEYRKMLAAHEDRPRWWRRMFKRKEREP